MRRLTLVGTGISLPSVGAAARRYSLATAALEAAVRAAPREVEVTRLDLQLSLDAPRFGADELEAVLATEPDVLGLSCYCWDLAAQLELAREVRRRRPGVLTVLGGPSASFQPAELLDAVPAVDVVVRGEGERSLVELLDRGGDPEGLAGLSYRGPDGQVHHEPDRPTVESLDELPSPLLEDALIPPRENLLFEFSRGCRYRCTYCAWKLRGAGERSASAARIEAELRWAVERGYRHGFVIDSAINGDDQRLAAIAGAVERVDPDRSIALSYFVDHRNLTEGQLPHLAALRTHEITVGLESVNPAAMRAAGRRKLDLARFGEALERLGAIAPVTLSIMLGMPGDTLEGFNATLDAVDALERRCRLRAVRVHWMLVAPGSSLWRRAERYGLDIAGEGIPYVLGSDSFPRDELIRAMEALRLHRRAELFTWEDAEPPRLLGAEAPALFEAGGERLGHDLGRSAAAITDEEALAAIRPLAPGRSSAGRLSIRPVERRGGHPVVTVESDDGARARVQLRRRGAEPSPLARTRSFDLIWLAPEGDRDRSGDARRLARLVVEAVRRNDR